MKKITCNKCGNKEAADFIFRILCPSQSCSNYDQKLELERQQENELDFIVNDDGDICLPDLNYYDDKI